MAESNPVAGAGRGSPRRSPRSTLRIIAVGVLGLVAAAAYVCSGLLLALAATFTPKPGNDAVLLLVKVVDLLGWLAIGRWLLLDWLHSRVQVVAAPAAAWLWTYAFAWLASAVGFLNWGY